MTLILKCQHEIILVNEGFYFIEQYYAVWYFLDKGAQKPLKSTHWEERGD